MVFVERALSMMTHGYAAIIIQNSAGSGKAAGRGNVCNKKAKRTQGKKKPGDNVA